MASDVNRSFPSSRIYIGEHLTPENKLILRQLKDACRELNIKYVWCREGKFFVRRSEGANSVKVNCMEDLDKVK